MRLRDPMLFAALLLTGAGSVWAIQLGLLDDFEDQTTQGWTEGDNTPNPPVVLLGCGETGSFCLENVSSGGIGPGNSQVIFNETQWSGDYVAAGVNKVQLQVGNSGATALSMRAGVSNGTTCYVSTTAAAVAAGSPLTLYSFLLTTSQMTRVNTGNVCGGAESLATVLSDVTHLRIYSAAALNWSGDSVISTAHYEAIQSKSDADADGINDDLDNCTDVANADQRDTDGDRYGNICDADLDNNCNVDFVDLGIMKSLFFSTDPEADLDGSGTVTFGDLGILKGQFFGDPGPGLGTCGACVPPASALDPAADFGSQMFFRGGIINDWGAVVGSNDFANMGDGVYVTRFEANTGTFGYKVADAGWSIEYCTTTQLQPGTPLNLPLFGCPFPANGSIAIPANGCYEFAMSTDGNVPPLTVEMTFTPITP